MLPVVAMYSPWNAATLKAIRSARGFTNESGVSAVGGDVPQSKHGVEGADIILDWTDAEYQKLQKALHKRDERRLRRLQAKPTGPHLFLGKKKK